MIVPRLRACSRVSARRTRSFRRTGSRAACGCQDLSRRAVLPEPHRHLITLPARVCERWQARRRATTHLLVCDGRLYTPLVLR
eukprot:3658882-Prymnesium_polylepis.1